MVKPLANISSQPFQHCHPQNSYLLVGKPPEGNVVQFPTASENTLTPAPPKKTKSFTSELLKKLNVFHRLNDYLLFNPTYKAYSSPKDMGLAFENVFIQTPDQELLHGYFLPAKVPTDKVAIFLHGNDFNVTRWFIAPMNLQEHLNINFLIVDYRGYGRSTGKPTCDGVIADAIAMYDFLLSKGFKSENISIYGRSLGGAVGLELASRLPVRCVVDQSSISSLKDIFKEKLPRFLSFIARKDVFNSRELVKKIQVPILISHGTKDTIVPISHAHTLYENANEPKKLIILDGAGHEHLKDYYTDEYFDVLRKLFL